MESATQHLIAPRRRIIMADGSERPFPDSLIGQWDAIKAILGIQYVEIVRLPSYGREGDWIMMIDEEAKIKTRYPARNVEATMLYHAEHAEAVATAIAKGFMVDYIAGNAAVCRFADFPDE